MILNITNILHDTFMLQNGENNTEKSFFYNNWQYSLLCCMDEHTNKLFLRYDCLASTDCVFKYKIWHLGEAEIFLFIYLFTLFTLFRLYGDDDM